MGKKHNTFEGEQPEMPIGNEQNEVEQPKDPKAPEIPEENTEHLPDELPSDNPTEIKQ